jgi:hypothetical protein
MKALLAAAVLTQSLVAVVAAAGPAAADGLCLKRSVSISDAIRVEGNQASGLTMRFDVSTSGCGEANVQVRTVPLVAAPTLFPATEVADFVFPGAVLNWFSGDTTGRTVSVTIVGDTREEQNETIMVELFNPSSGVTLTDPIAYGAILNDDITEIMPDNEPECGGMGGVFNCTLDIVASVRSEMDLTVHFATINGTALSSEDFFGVTFGTLVIPAEGTRGTISVAYRADRRMTVPEYFYITIFDPSHGTITVNQQKVILPVP